MIDYDLDIIVRILYYILSKYPEFGNANILRSILKTDSETLSYSSQDTLSRGQKPVQIISDAIPNHDRFVIVFRSFLLLLADVEDFINRDFEDSFNNSNVANHSEGSVLIEAKLRLARPSYPDFSQGNNLSRESLSFIHSRNHSIKVEPFQIKEISHVY